VLPLVPEPTTVNKKEDLAQVDLLSDPTDADLTKVKFVFKALEGGTETAHEIIQLFQTVDRAFAGLNSTQQHGSASNGFNAGTSQLAEPARLQAIAAAEAAANSDNGMDVARAGRLAACLVAMQAPDNGTVLGANDIGTAIVTATLVGYNFAPQQNPTTCQEFLEM